MATTSPRRLFTVDDYHRMADAGILTEDDRVELLGGEIRVMAAIGTRHQACVLRLTALFGRLAARALLSAQGAVRLDRLSEPEPDIALLAPRDDFYAAGHPRPEDVRLLVEVSDSSLAYDRGEKLPRYAAAGILEVWIADLVSDRLEVHREPAEDGHRSVRIVTRGEAIAPLAFPDFEVRADDVLP